MFKNIFEYKNLIKINFFLICLFVISFLLHSCNYSKKIENNNIIIGRIDLRKIKDSEYYKQIQNKIYNLEIEYKDQLNKISINKDEKDLKEAANKLSNILENKKQEYLQEFYKKLEKAVITVANKEKIGIILSSDAILYGYKDITDEVIKTIDSNNNLDINPNLNYSLKIAYLDLNNLKNKDIDFEKLYKDKQNDVYIVFGKSNVLLGGIDLTNEIQKYIALQKKFK
ncbi:MAG: OmpH family outer membrane protein [bacterium]|jgi:Skp family chaperone for outer membrane proteins